MAFLAGIQAQEVAAEEPPRRAGLVLEDASYRVLFLGDSMSFGGFGDRLDELLRSDPGVSHLYTYMACGVFPLSWTKIPPFANIKTSCGYTSIEPGDNPLKPQRFVDVYGRPAGHVPSSHRVPKIETLLDTAKPDVIVFQSGNNFFSCFKDRRTIQEEYHRKYIRSLTIPFLKHLVTAPSNLKRIYWITPPEAGSVTEEIQEFVFQEIQHCAGDIATIIDSRTLTDYPYKVMDRDKEHFWGDDAIAWADKVYSAVIADLLKNPAEGTPLLADVCRDHPPRILKESEMVKDKRPVVKVSAKLVACTEIPDPSAFPYGEYLVGYRYQILRNRSGGYEGKEILVMHPSYVKKVVRDLSAFKIGGTYNLEVVEIDDKSLWAAVNRKDDVGDIEMIPYIQVADEKLHPEYNKEN